MPALLIPVELDRPRNIKLDLNALVLFEMETGQSFRSVDLRFMNMTQFRALLYATLKWEDPELTIDAVGAMVDSENMKTLTEYLIEGKDTVETSEGVPLKVVPDPNPAPRRRAGNG